MEQGKVKVNSYIRVIKGYFVGKIYKVFDISSEGNFIAVGVKNTIRQVSIYDVVIDTEENFNDANQDELLQEVSFLP